METALTFNDVVLTPISHQDCIWIKGTDLARALKYKRGDIINKLYKQNEDEFTPEMTQVIEIPDNTESVVSENLITKCRIFSPRGCYLISMFARTPVAKAFRKWVLDVLDRIAKEENQPQQTEDQDAPIGPADQNILQAIVRAKVAQMPEASSRGGFPQIWSRFNNHFRLGSYKQLPQSKMAEAVEYLVKLEVQKDKTSSQKALPGGAKKWVEMPEYAAKIDRLVLETQQKSNEFMKAVSDLGYALLFRPACLDDEVTDFGKELGHYLHGLGFAAQTTAKSMCEMAEVYRGQLGKQS